MIDGERVCFYVPSDDPNGTVREHEGVIITKDYIHRGNFWVNSKLFSGPVSIPVLLLKRVNKGGRG